MKRIISVFLTVVICLSIMPFNALADAITDASAVNSIIEKITDVNVRTKLEEVLSEYPSGSSFSNDYNWEWKINSKITSSAEQGEAWQCYGFALYVYASVFGLHGGGIYVEHTKDGESDKLLSGALEASYQSFLESGVKAGAHIRTTDDFSSVTNALDGGHSMIVLHYDSDYLYVYHGNADGNGEVRVTQYTWDDFNSKQLEGKSTPRRIKYVAVPKPQYYEGGSVPSITYPANNATNIPYDFFTLKWTAVASADSYRVSVRDITGGVDGEKPFEDMTSETNYVDIPYYALSQASTYRVYVEAIVDGAVYPCEEPYPTFTTCKQPELSINETFIYPGIDNAEFTISSFDNFNSNVLVVADAITDARCLTVDVEKNKTYELDTSKLEYGEYYAYFTAGDGNGMVDSNMVYFTICEGTDVEPDNDTYDCGKITIDIDEVTESTYWFNVEGFNFSEYSLIGAECSNNILDVTATNIVPGSNSFGLTIAPKSCGTSTVAFVYSPCDETGNLITTYYFTVDVEIVKSNATNEELFDYELLNGEATITDCDTSASGDIVIPSKLGGYPVTSIGEFAFYNCRELTSITIPDSVKTIESDAFMYCSSLTSITIPNSVISIGEEAFRDCESLTSIELPVGITSIEDFTFYYCENLTNIKIPESVTSIGEYAFSRCSSLSSITLPKKLTSIGVRAFEDCESLMNIEIPEGLTSICKYTFYNCSKLTSIKIPEGVTNIGIEAFSRCYDLASVTIPKSLKEIEYEAFFGCSIEEVYYSGSEEDWNNITIGERNDELINATIYYGPIIKYEGIYTYEVLNGEATITACSTSAKGDIEIPSTLGGYPVTSIGEESFRDCDYLTSIIIPDSVISIGKGAFWGCINLTSIEIPDGITKIKDYTFCSCYNLTNIKIPDSVTSIGYVAFLGSGLTNVVIPEGVTSIGPMAFTECRSLTSITIPKSVTSIGNETFARCNNLITIEIPDGITSIGDNTFTSCNSLTSIRIPKSVTSIGYAAFSSCKSLTDVYYSGSETDWSNISLGTANDYLTKATIHYGEEFGESILYNFAVTPESSSAGKNYLFHIEADVLPDNAFLQFDDPDTGEWFDESYASSSWAFSWRDYIISDGRFVLERDMIINSPGSEENEYKRKVRVIHYTDDGVKRASETISFVVTPKDEEIPEITIYDASYTINGNNLVITVLTSPAVEKLKVENNQTTMNIFNSGYVDQNEEERLWTITKSLDYYANKSLTFIPGNNDYGYSDSTYELFINYDAPSSMGTLLITSPVGNSPHEKGQDLVVSWRAPMVEPDSYVLTVSYNNETIHTQYPASGTTSADIDGSIFADSGTYYISLTAKKDGYADLYEVTYAYIESDEYIPVEPMNGVNPTVKEICDYVYNYLKNIDLGKHCPDAYRAICAMIKTEGQSMRQFDDNGNVLTGVNKKKVKDPVTGKETYVVDSYDYGLCQLNSKIFEPGGFFADEDIELAKTNWQYNVALGIRKYGSLYYAFTNEQLYIDRLEYMMSKGVDKYEAMARSTYSMYNAGTDEWKRWLETPETGDKNYEKFYREKPWERETGEYIDENKTIEVSIPGVINVARDVYIAVRASASDSSAIIGRFSNGTKVNVDVGARQNSYLYVEGLDYESGRTIAGYVKAEYVSYDNYPVKKESSFVGTVNKTSINIGDEVTFTVNATYGSYDFRISFDESYEESVKMNYLDGVYNYPRKIMGIGPRKARMSWYDPSAETRVSVDFPTIEVWIPDNGWKSCFNGNILTIEQECIIGDTYIEHGNNDVKYGLYIKNTNGIYSFGAYERNYDTRIEQPGEWGLYRTWNVSKELKLVPGTYEYGVVAYFRNNRRECKLSTFTLEQYNAETETLYVGPSTGARVYEEVPNGSLTENPYIELEQGQKVERIYGTENGKYNGYAQVIFPWTDGDGNTYSYTKWISNEALIEYDPFGLELTYTSSDSYKKSKFYEAVTEVHLTGDYRKDILNVAKSQVGYREGYEKNDFSGLNDGTKGHNNYTEYNYWWTNNANDGGYNNMYWCASFVSWCARQARIPPEIIINYRGCTTFRRNVIERKIGTLYSGKDRNPKPGDLFFTVEYDGENIVYPHTGIVVDINPDDQSKFISYEGNADPNGNSNNGIAVVERRNRKIADCHFFAPDYDLIKKAMNNNTINLFSLSDESTDMVSYYISCYDEREDNFKNLKGANNGVVSLEVPEKTCSINVHIPIDESRQFVTLYHAGQSYENGSKFNFSANIISFKATIKDLVGDEEYEFDFKIHRKFSEEKTTINYAKVSYYNADDECIGGDVVDFDSPEIGNAPFTTAYVKFNNVDNEAHTIEVSTGLYYEENVWFPISYKFDSIGDEQIFVFNVINGTDIQTVEYTITRDEKSNDTSLQTVFVSAYGENKELFASNTYVVDDDVISINLPYSTKYFSLNVEKTSLFATADTYINKQVISSEDLIDVSNIESSYIDVVAEDGTIKKYEIQINIATAEDITAPIISVVGESGTVYSSGSEIHERVIYSATDESWYGIYLSLNGEVLDEMEGISENGEYTLTAVDVFGNESEFKFVYKDYDYALEFANAEFEGNTINISVTTDNATGTTKNATLFMAAYNAEGKLLALQTDDEFVMESGIATKSMEFGCSEVKENEIIVKLFVWESGKSIEPIATAIQTTVSKN